VTRHIFLIGAARSGTKIMRDVLAAAAEVGAVPYDVNFVWTYGHQSVPDDVLSPDRVNERKRRFVSGYLDRYAAGAPRTVIEKTVGNSLRVPYVQAMFPDASFVHLVRDGVDAVESSRRQWQSPPDRRYLAQKVRHFPLRLVPTYGLSFARDQVRRRSPEDQGSSVRSWGVRYPGIGQDVRAEPLLTVCARQWRESVSRASEAFETMSARVVHVRYEELVAAPDRELARVLDELGLPASPARVATAAGRLRGDRSGVGASALSAEELASLEGEIGDALGGLGYPPATDPGRIGG
jgi:hypothetical protein